MVNYWKKKELKALIDNFYFSYSLEKGIKNLILVFLMCFHFCSMVFSRKMVAERATFAIRKVAFFLEYLLRKPQN